MSRSRAPVAGDDILTLARGYPPVLGAMFLVDGVLTVILGGDATVSLGEVVAYLLLPPLAMFLLTRLTGGRRPGAVTLGVGVAGAAVLVAALFLLGGVHLVTLPGWALALCGLVLLGAAVALMRRAAPAGAPAVSPLLSQDERASFSSDPFSSDPAVDSSASDDSSDFGSLPGGRRSRAAGAASDGYGASSGEYGASSGEYGVSSAEYGAAAGGYGSEAADYGAASGGPAAPGGDRPAEFTWPPPRRDDESRPYAGGRAADDTVPGLPRIPAEPAAGPSEPDWPPRRDPRGTRPTWDDRDDAGGDRSTGAVGGDWSTGNVAAGGAGTGSGWTDGPTHREWPPSSPHRDSEPGRHSWFDTDEDAPPQAEASEPTWQPGPPDSEWPPADRTYPSGGRRSRHPNQ